MHEKTEKYIYNSEIKSLLDIVLMPMHHNSEKSYSAPFSSHLYSKETVKQGNNSEIRIYPDLLYKGNHNKYSDDKAYNISDNCNNFFYKIIFYMFFNLYVNFLPNIV